jgi:radical SAM superfamily enzyme YgiQ (UPF0313 family)
LWPNFDCPIGLSIGVAYLSGALQKAGHETNIIHVCEWLDYPFDLDRIESDVRAYGPDLIAVSTGFPHYPEMRQTASRLKKALGAPILFGGIHTTQNAEAVIQENPWVDFANIGEGDDSLLDLVAALETGGATTNIPNVWARENGTIVRNCSRPLKDITTLPWMDLEGWQFKRISENRRGWVNVYMNRGCPYRCTYCHNNGVAKVLQQSFNAPTSSNDDLGYLRLRSVDDMIGELKSILTKYDFVTTFLLMTIPSAWTRAHEEFLVQYKDEIGLPFVCNTTVLDVDREMLEVMKSELRPGQFRGGDRDPRIKKQILRGLLQPKNGRSL